MEKDLNESVVHNSSCLKEAETDKSFVGKVKSIIINTPLSKWFRKQDDNRSAVRRRDEVFDEDICEMQPPSKRVKLPPCNDRNSCDNILFFNESGNTPITDNINITNTNLTNFSEPAAGPSGIKSRKFLSGVSSTSANSARCTFNSTELLNGHKDSDSEESTSGYSSVARIGSKEQVCGSQQSSKQTSPLQNSPSNSRSLFNTSNAGTSRSLFSDRSLSPNMHTSLSSRRPNFNASTFGSPNFVDKTLSTKRIINSPFYNGQTIYGGAAAYGRTLGRSSQELKTSLRTSVQIKPVNKTSENGNVVLGKTARKILDTLEQYSSPINDAKKIPVVSKKMRQDGLLTKYTGTNPYIVRESKVSSNRELQVPSVSELLKMKQKTRLQDSTEAFRLIAASSKSDLNVEGYNIVTNEHEKQKHTRKMKTKIASARQKQQKDETIGEVNLLPVALPITKLPTFNLNIPPPTPHETSKSPTQPVTKVQPAQIFNVQSAPKTVETEKIIQIEKQTTVTVMDYTFSDPVVIAENVKSIIPINNFKFSEPLSKLNRTDSASDATLNFNMPDKTLPKLLTNANNSSKSPRKRKSTMLKTGSIMDILGKKDNSLIDKFKPAPGTWECLACMIRNEPDKKKCAACETPKVVKPAENKEGFGSQFKMSADKWECSACMVRNNDSDATCIACTTPRINDKLMPKKTNSGFPTENKNEAINCSASEAVKSTAMETSNFGNKFKPSPNSWECESCLVRNDNKVTKCIACNSPMSNQVSTSKPASFGQSFIVKKDEWECGDCMVRNKLSHNKCQCCSSAKPGSNPTAEVNDDDAATKFNFGVDKAGFSFGIPPTLPTTISKPETNAASIFGEGAKPATATPPGFTFGVPSSTQNDAKSFEIPKQVDASKNSVIQASNPLLKPSEKLPQVKPASAEFKFGVAAPTLSNIADKTADTQKLNEPKSGTSSSSNATKPMFNFKQLAANENVNKSVTSFIKKPDAVSNATSVNPPATAGTNIFNFGAKPAAVAAPLVSTPTTQSSQSASSKSLFRFGSDSHSTSDTSFGSTKPGGSLNNGFGTTSTQAFGATNTSTFEVPMTNSSELKSFAFGNTSTTTGEPVNKAPMFAFGQSPSTITATKVSAKPSEFTFTSTSTPPTFNFAAAKPESAGFSISQANNVFGSASTSGKNGTFNFGSIASSNTNHKASFSFGAPVNNTSASSAQSGFNFGAAAVTPVPQSGGFNFTGAPPTFNAAAKPSFNFTDGSVSAFSAQPTTEGGVAAPRKIKRAVRRTQR